MKALRGLLDKAHPLFVKGGKLEKGYPVYEALDTFLYTPGEVSKGASHVRDALDNKRLMITVAVALVPCILMAMFNTGYQANMAIASMGVSPEGWRADIIMALGLGFDSQNVIHNFVYGFLYFFPVFLVTQLAGGFWEMLFASVRGHEINEGFLVTGMLFPLTLPPTIPLWQVAVGISFGVVIGKEVFGGVGKNFLNPALTARAFLFFAYPAQISGDFVWTAVDGFSGATALSIAANGGQEALAAAISWQDAFLGLVQGSMGETSTLACLLGAVILIATGIGSWRVMLGMVVGAGSLAWLLHGVGSNPMFSISPAWHLVMGGFAFGCVFMATDPVSAAMTNRGRYIYGALIGVMSILVRSINPAFPEGVMLAILFGNVFAPLIDYYVVKANIKRRMQRCAVGRSI